MNQEHKQEWSYELAKLEIPFLYIY